MSKQPLDPERRANHLLGQTSPYLLQHLYNPVDWHAWGPEALERARVEDKPIFLSIGYAACHWCHVMEHESFEDPQIAAYLNEHFVSIKVDREERPDLDEIYMNAVQLLTQSGGWPLNVFLTPELRPFLGGTYFPPEDRHGRIGFPALLARIKEAWTDKRQDVDRSAVNLHEHLQRIAIGLAEQPSERTVDRTEIARAAFELTRRFDSRWGGFGAAPKFPADGALALLLREHARSGESAPLEMVTTTLDRMALGGIYDQIGGGFARYSVDELWLVPHFEKMLYNQALLTPVFVDAWRVSRKPLYRRVACETLDFVRRELTDPLGGFYSSLDADSDGREGAFYVWTAEEIDEALGAEGAFFRSIYDITPGGNFEGSNIANLIQASLAERASRMNCSETQLVQRLCSARSKLLEVRERRTRPATDDKVLTSWNGLMLTAFTRAHQAFGRPEDLRAAQSAADFVLEHLTRGDRLLVSYREGKAHLNGYLDDYAFFGRGLLDLYETCFDGRYFAAAERIAREMLKRFEDAANGGFFFTSDDHEAILTRNRSLHDGALPSGGGVAAELLLRLAFHLDDEGLRRSAVRALKSSQPMVERSPSAYAALLTAADFAIGPVVEAAVIGDPDEPKTQELLAAIRAGYHPRLALASARPGEAPGRLALLAGRTSSDGAQPLAYVCRDYACRRPTSDPDELLRLMDDPATR